MRRTPILVALTAAILAVPLGAALSLTSGPALAYSYAAAGAEPLLDGREALFSAVAEGDWDAAQQALEGMKGDLDYIDENEDEGVSAAFADAIAARDAEAVRAAFNRVAIDEIQRRLDGAAENLSDYQAAKTLVVKAQRFYTAIAGDLDAAATAVLPEAFQRALDAVGNPGVFGVGAKDPDPEAFATAQSDILTALGLTYE